MIEFITDTEIYTNVILQWIPHAENFIWIATADIKDMYMEHNRRMVPLLEVLADRIERGVSVRLIHAKEPGPRFREDFDRFPVLIDGLERLLCPRVHFKAVVVDGERAYTGSANLTGAGMGAKSETRRNFESGVITTERSLIDAIMEQFDRVWIGHYCDSCGRKSFCSDYIDMP
jgi:phosphatidylserine/phosphatidylglycerophosphate/cardiolipin synthase-like enzyme